jgi:hypothetical protein
LKKFLASVKEGSSDSEDGAKVESYEAANRDELDSLAIDNMIYYMYRRDHVELLNKRRLQHWFDIFKQIMGKVQFLPVLRLLERHEIQKEKNTMLQR